MIRLKLPATIECDEPGCNASQDAHLVLLFSGGFGAKPLEKGWRVGPNQQGAFVALCPQHNRVVQTVDGKLVHPGNGVSQ